MSINEEPIQEYFPGALVRLIVRFEDFGSRLLAPAPNKLPQQLKGAGKNPALAVARDGNQWVLNSKGGSKATKAGEPQRDVTSADDFTHGVGGIIPISATFKRQGIREGNRLSVELRYADFPIDPRAIRSCGIEFYLGTISADTFDKGMSGNGPNPSGRGEPLNVIPYVYTDDNGKQRTNLRFQGWVDDIEIEYPEDDEPIVRLECSDNSRLLVDQIAPPGLTISGNKTIDEAVADYLAQFPQFRGLNVEYRPGGVTPPKLTDALAKTAFRPNLGPAPSKGGDSKLSVMDYIVDVAGALGHIAYVDGRSIVIQLPHTKYSNRYSGRTDDPFTGRVLPSSRTLTNRLMIYGRNIESMQIRRRFTKATPTNIEVRSYWGAQKTTLVARYPVKGDRVLRALPGDTTDQKWQVVRVRGVKDKKTLRLIAQTYYELQGRNEISINLVTTRLASFGGGNADPDLLDMKEGDSIDVGVDRDLLYTAGSVEQENSSDAKRFLMKLGYGDKFADAYDKAINNIGLPKTFRVRTVQYDWSNEDGVTINMELINYIEIRSDKVLPKGEEIEPPPLNVKPVTVVVEED
jgi:hypothetical protein